MKQLNTDDLQFIRESLEYTRLKFESYQDYPSYEFKQTRIKIVNDTLGKINQLLKEKK